MVRPRGPTYILNTEPQPDLIMNAMFRSCLLFLLASIGLGAAELPQKAALDRYKGLWLSSPFTTKPPPMPNAPPVNPFEDWALKGIAPTAPSGKGYIITFTNRKKPGEPVPPIDTDLTTDYKVIKVERNPDKPLSTVVYLSKGSGPNVQTGTVTYPDKITPPKPTVTKPAPPQPGAPVAGQAPPQPGQLPQPSMQQQRPRVVPAAAPAAGARPPVPGAGGRPPVPGASSSSRGGSSTSHQRTHGRP